jgi:hypothetical protein
METSPEGNNGTSYRNPNAYRRKHAKCFAQILKLETRQVTKYIGQSPRGANYHSAGPRNSPSFMERVFSLPYSQRPTGF